MNKMTRFGIIVLVLGLSFAVLAVIRGGSTVSGGMGVQFGSYGSQTATFFWVPRDLKLRVDSGEGVNINLVDPSQVTILKAEDVKEGDTFTVHLEKRGTYTLLFYNPSNSTTEIDLYFALYNLESDIVLASVILIISGTIIIVARSLYVAYKNRMIQMPKRCARGNRYASLYRQALRKKRQDVCEWSQQRTSVTLFLYYLTAKETD